VGAILGDNLLLQIAGLQSWPSEGLSCSALSPGSIKRQPRIGAHKHGSQLSETEGWFASAEHNYLTYAPKIHGNAPMFKQNSKSAGYTSLASNMLAAHPGKSN